MGDPKDEAIDLMARALSTVLYVTSPNDLDLAFRQYVRCRVGEYPDADWSRVEGFVNEAFNANGSVSEIRRLALEPEYLAEMSSPEPEEDE